MAYPPAQLTTTEKALRSPIVANPIVDCREYRWVRTDLQEIVILLNESGTENLVLPNMQFRQGYETEHHIIVSFSERGQKLLSDGQVVILSKAGCVRNPSVESGLVSCVVSCVDDENRNPSGFGWSISRKTRGFWMRTDHDEIHIAYACFGDKWDVELTYTEDEVDFESRTIVDDKTLLYDGVVMVLDTDKERFTRVETTQSWRDKRTMSFEPYVEEQT